MLTPQTRLEPFCRGHPSQGHPMGSNQYFSKKWLPLKLNLKSDDIYEWKQNFNDLSTSGPIWLGSNYLYS